MFIAIAAKINPILPSQADKAVFRMLCLDSQMLSSVFFIMQARFKVQSCSSQCSGSPAANLLSRNGAWQSQRFCDYPQQLTISFFEPILLSTIKIVSHPTKVPSRVNILYHLPEHNDQGFLRYGYVTFDEPKDSNSQSEAKLIEKINVKAKEVRFIFVRSYQNKANFFGQVGLNALEFTGEPIDHVFPSLVQEKTISKGFEAQTTLLMQLKQSFVKRQQFQEAKQVKQMELVLRKASDQVFELEKEKKKCVISQDFLGAKKIRDELLRLKQKVADLATKFYDSHGQIRMIKSDVALKQKIEQMNLTPKSSSFKLKQSRKLQKQDVIQPLRDVGEVTSEDEEGALDDFNQSMISHDERILPAVINKMKGSNPQPIIQASELADNQFYQSSDKATLPAEPEPIGPADEANSSLLLDFYQPMFIRKLHSKFWQYRLQAITQAYEQLKSSNDPSFLTKQRLRCYLFIYSKSLKISSFKTTTTVLDMMSALTQTKPSEAIGKELHNELQAAVKATLKLLGDSNQKIRTHAQKTVLRMIESQAFGVHACYSGLVKSYPDKGVSRLKKIRLQTLIQLVKRYGIGQTAVPHSIADFVVRAANDPESEVRKLAVELAKSVKSKGGRNKLEDLLTDSRVKSPNSRQF